MAGSYEPGQKLKLRDIARRFEVSVTPVREALGRLVSEQALVQLDHRSVSVPLMDLARFDEVRDLRLQIEGMAAERAARTAGAAEIDALEAVHTRLMRGRNRGCATTILRENGLFHLTLCRAAQAEVHLQLVETLWLQCGPLMHGMTRWPVVRPEQHPHEDVIGALRRRDGRSARTAIEQDILMSMTALRAYLGSRSEQAEVAGPARTVISLPTR